MEGFKPKVYKVKNDTGHEYLVGNFRPNRWVCNCPDFYYRGHDQNGYRNNHKCKHILRVINQLREEEPCASI